MPNPIFYNINQFSPFSAPMSQNNVIEHEGTVVSIDGDVMQVSILSTSACASCKAAQLCTASELKEKMVRVALQPGEVRNVGDHVVVQGTETMGTLAIFVAYVSPLILMLLGLLFAKALHASDATAGIAALAMLIPYYIILKFVSPRIDKEFRFKTKYQS